MGDLETGLIHRFYAGYNSHDASAVARLYAVNGGHADAVAEKRKAGRDAIQTGLAGLFEAFPDANWHIRKTIVGEGLAAVQYLLTGTLMRSFGPYSSRGQRLELEGVHVFEFSGDHIAETRDFWDSGVFHRQMSRDA